MFLTKTIMAGKKNTFMIPAIATGCVVEGYVDETKLCIKPRKWSVEKYSHKMVWLKSFETEILPSAVNLCYENAPVAQKTRWLEEVFMQHGPGVYVIRSGDHGDLPVIVIFFLDDDERQRVVVKKLQPFMHFLYDNVVLLPPPQDVHLAAYALLDVDKIMQFFGFKECARTLVAELKRCIFKDALPHVLIEQGGKLSTCALEDLGKTLGQGPFHVWYYCPQSGTLKGAKFEQTEAGERSVVEINQPAPTLLLQNLKMRLEADKLTLGFIHHTFPKDMTLQSVASIESEYLFASIKIEFGGYVLFVIRNHKEDKVLFVLDTPDAHQWVVGVDVASFFDLVEPLWESRDTAKSVKITAFALHCNGLCAFAAATASRKWVMDHGYSPTMFGVTFLKRGTENYKKIACNLESVLNPATHFPNHCVCTCVIDGVIMVVDVIVNGLEPLSLQDYMKRVLKSQPHMIGPEGKFWIKFTPARWFKQICTLPNYVQDTCLFELRYGGLLADGPVLKDLDVTSNEQKGTERKRSDVKFFLPQTSVIPAFDFGEDESSEEEPYPWGDFKRATKKCLEETGYEPVTLKVTKLNGGPVPMRPSSKGYPHTDHKFNFKAPKGVTYSSKDLLRGRAIDYILTGQRTSMPLDEYLLDVILPLFNHRTDLNGSAFIELQLAQNALYKFKVNLEEKTLEPQIVECTGCTIM